MSATPGGGRGRGRGTGKETGPERTVIGMGRGKSRQTTTPPLPTPSGTVPPEIEEIVRAQQAEMKELAKQLGEDNTNVQEAENNLSKTNDASLPAPQSPQTSNLNPNCPEFIPRSQQPSNHQPTIVNSKLNADAPEFVPSSTMGTTLASMDMDMFEPQIAALGVTVADMVAPFMTLVPDDELYLLDSAAELLLKCAASPELFDTEMDCLLSTIKQNKPDVSTLSNMAKLVIIWGEKDTTLQYVASKFCAHCFLPLSERGFTDTLAMTVRDKSSELYGHATDPQDVIRFSTFLAELFFRIRTKEDNPMWPFGTMLTQLIQKLLTLPYNQSVMSIVNMLKLTGSIMDSSETLKVTLDAVTAQLSTIIQENVHNLSSHVCTAVKQLLELRSNQWSPPTPKMPIPAMYTTEDDTVYFMPTGSTNIPGFKEEQAPFQPQQQLPVVNPADWSEYIIEDDAANTADNGSYDADFLEEDDLEAAFEDFLQETHSHYRMFPSYHP